MRFGFTNVQTHRGNVANHFGGPKRVAKPRYKVRWPIVVCVAFSLAFWIGLLFGVAAVMK